MATNGPTHLSYFIHKDHNIPPGYNTQSSCTYELTVHGVRCLAKGFLKEDQNEFEKDVMSMKFSEECELFNNLRHPNIVQCLGISHIPQNGTPSEGICLMEYMHMDLETCLSKYPNIINPIKFSILCDVSHGLLHLHSQDPPIIHRDLTATNILLTPDMRAKIADLGMSRIFELQQLQTSKLTKAPGASAYMPPEALTEEPIYDSKLDIFSFGAVALYTGNQEFPLVYEVYPIPTEVVVKKELQVLKRKRWMDKLGSAHPLHPLITRCLLDDPAMRPSTAELCSEMEKLCHEYPWGFENIMKSDVSDLTVKAQEMEIKHLLSHLSEMEDDMKARQDDMDKCMQQKDEEMETILKDYTAVHKQLEDTTQELKSMKKEIEQKFLEMQSEMVQDKIQLQNELDKDIKCMQLEKKQQQDKFEVECKQMKLEMEKKEMQLQEEFTEKLRLMQLEIKQQQMVLQKELQDQCRQIELAEKEQQQQLTVMQKFEKKLQMESQKMNHEYQQILEHCMSEHAAEISCLQLKKYEVMKTCDKLTKQVQSSQKQVDELEEMYSMLNEQEVTYKQDKEMEQADKKLIAEKLSEKKTKKKHSKKRGN